MFKDDGGRMLERFRVWFHGFINLGKLAEDVEQLRIHIDRYEVQVEQMISLLKDMKNDASCTKEALQKVGQAVYTLDAALTDIIEKTEHPVKKDRVKKMRRMVRYNNTAAIRAKQ